MSHTTETQNLRDDLKPADGDEGPKYKSKLDEKAKCQKYSQDQEPSLIKKGEIYQMKKRIEQLNP